MHLQEPKRMLSHKLTRQVRPRSSSKAARAAGVFNAVSTCMALVRKEYHTADDAEHDT
jgi:hypothetical protein